MIANIAHLKSAKVLVVGDLMLDTYHIGDVKRISPEAPVPVVRVTKSYSVLGGAANVARNLLGLCAKPYVVGIVGEDMNGKLMQQMFAELAIEHTLAISTHPTITKTRIIGNNQQIVRVDFEQDNITLPSTLEKQLLDGVAHYIDQVDIVVLSDYNKGTCTPAVCQQVIEIARRANKQVIVDPKGTEWCKYKGAAIVTPNIKELSDIAMCDIKNEDNQILAQAQQVVERYNFASLLVTRSEKGMSYITPTIASHIPTAAREVFDVSGAGDTVVATLAAALAAKLTVAEAIYIANKAAGIVVAKIGTSPIIYEELENEIAPQYAAGKVVTEIQLPHVIAALRKQGKRIVFTNGCFDILHKGHVVYMEQAKALGDILVVGLNSDSSVKRLKGESRPINDEDARATVLAALESVDYVVQFTEDTPYNLIKTVAPDTLVKGGDYEIENIVGREFAQETVVISFVDGFSTTRTLEKMAR